MPIKCPKCDMEFGDLQYGEGEETYNVFNEKITKHRCPKCQSLISHNWDTLEDYLE